ncbi:protoporphyrinogen oxidase [Corynebacterium uropygiale]|uniref:Coproporphyrinogen III oxidase n=1 Tax=Corynebacterium uropygiale TaxID=1775911 RepID=A0A9X1TXA1_9CORY|nr:protoporphyrinogen oxidase [Corynebacterium uropygiale]MCF4005825.1 protoporphyrinogen oxidase [Corynebacterium uropygiale]
MRYAVIGAGLAGLSAAYEIHQHAPEAAIEVFEATDRIGGKMFSVPFHSGPVDMGAEAFLARNQEAYAFFTEELGLRTVTPSGLPSSVYMGGQLRPLPHAGMMGIPADAEPIREIISEESARRIDAEAEQDPIPWTPGQDYSAGRLVRERYGDDVVDRLVSALLGGVYSCTADDLGIRATIPRLAATFDAMAEAGEPVYLSAAVRRLLEKRAQAAGSARGAGTGQGSVFAAFPGGYAEVYETLAERSGARIFIDAFITGLSRDPKGGYRLTGGGEGAYDRVILATPAPTTALLLKGIAPEAAQHIAGIRLASSAVVGMKFDTDEGLPQNSGILIAADEPGLHAKAFTLSSRKWPHLAERGGAVVRASFGRFGDDALVRAEEDDLVDYALDDLQAITGFDGRAAGLSEIYVQRWFGGIPCFDEHILERVRQAKEALAEISDLGVTGAWASGVGVPAVLADARRVARRLV